MKPIEYISWFKYAYEILIVNQWKNVDYIGMNTMVPTKPTHRQSKSQTNTGLGQDIKFKFITT